MTTANRSRLFELRRERGAAERSAELLDRKREVLLHELARRTAERDALRLAIVPRYAEAHAKLRAARMDAGPRAMAAAALAQPPRLTVVPHSTPVMGVDIVSLLVSVEPFRRFYSTVGTTESVDVAAAAFHELLPDLLRLAELELATRRLRLALRKTSRLLQALDKVLLPRIAATIRAIGEALEEEERDESVRHRAQRARSSRPQ